MSMKKKLVISIVAPAVVAGALAGGVVMSQKDKPFNPVAAEHIPDTAPVKVKPVEFVSESVLSGLEGDMVVTSSTAVVEPTVKQTEGEEVVEPVVVDAVAEMRQYILSVVPPSAVSTVTTSFYRSPDAFYKDRDAAIKICLDVIAENHTFGRDLPIIQARLAEL